MPKLIPISDLSDNRLCHYVDIRQARAASSSTNQEHFVAEGRHVVRRLIDSNFDLESVLIEADKEEPLIASLPEHVPVYTMSREQINHVVGFEFHRGILACGCRQPRKQIDEYLRAGQPQRSVAIGMLGISDQENMGGMLRTAAALGIDHVLLGPKTIDPISRRVIRVIMATAFKHQFYHLNDNVSDLASIAESGVQTIASTLDSAALSLSEFQRDDRPVLLLVGNESRGIERDVQAVADVQVRIPMQLGTDSLNVGTAAAILMYELKRGLLE